MNEAALAHALHDAENTTRPTDNPELLALYMQQATEVAVMLDRLGYRVVKTRRRKVACTG